MPAIRPFDHDFVTEAVERLGRIQADAQPAWGKMRADELAGHLLDILHFSMGREPHFPYVGNFVTRYLVRPLVLHGFIGLPKNVKAPPPEQQNESHTEPADLETLHAVLEEYLQAVESGALDPPLHPFFGDIGVDGWAKTHVLHFEHHMKQFGV